MQIFVSVKQLGKRRQAVEKVAFILENTPQTTAELITEVVKVCVKDYNERKEHHDLLSFLTKEAISDQAAAGKVGFGNIYHDSLAEEKAAVDNALLAFTDGIFRIFHHNEELTDLEAPLILHENDQLVFVRLVMLAGRMW